MAETVCSEPALAYVRGFSTFLALFTYFSGAEEADFTMNNERLSAT